MTTMAQRRESAGILRAATLSGAFVALAFVACSVNDGPRPDAGNDGSLTWRDGGGCPTGMSLCGDKCVDAQVDPAHCGSCGQTCAAGEVCSAGHCALSCQSGLVACGGKCIDPLVSNAYCGASGGCTGANAGTTCDRGHVCTGGACQLSCQSGMVACEGKCLDPLGSNVHCGASGNCTGSNAGKTCLQGEVCAAGTCAVTCQSGLIKCGGACVDPLVSNAHCGASGDCTGSNAGKTCLQGEVCAAGACAVTCQSGLIKCGGACVDPLTDNAFCGATGDCAGTNHGSTCLAGELCSGGKCAAKCQSGLIACGGNCIDPLTDNTFCGASGDCAGANDGTVCQVGQACSGGQCSLVCQAGLVKCGGVCTDPLTDNTFCGASGDCAGANDGTVCQAGQACSAGQCSLVCQAGLVKCGGVCINPLQNQTYCGASGDCAGASAGTSCGAPTVCSQGSCKTPVVRTLDAVERGFWDDKGNHSAGNNVADAGRNTEQRNAYFIFDLAGVSGTVIQAQLDVELVNIAGSIPAQTLDLYDVSTPPATLEATGGGQTQIYQDLETGNLYGQLTVAPADKGTVRTVYLGASAVADVQKTLGGRFALGVHNVSAVGATSNIYVRLAADTGTHVRRLLVTHIP